MSLPNDALLRPLEEAGILSTLDVELARAPLVSSPAQLDLARPLVLDAHQRLYLARYYDHEAQLAQQLLELARPSAAAPTLDVALLDRLFPPATSGARDLQREAALAA